MHKLFKPQRRLLFVLFLVGLLGINFGLSFCQAAKVDLFDVIGETQQTLTKEDGHQIFVWWMAMPYWKAVISRTDIPKGDSEMILNAINPYIILAISDFSLTNGGLPRKFLALEQIKPITRVEVDGKTCTPCARKDMNSLALKLVQKIEPDIPKLLDDKWQQVYLVMFKGEDLQPLINPAKPGTLIVNIGKDEFIWKTPLASAVPPQKCPTCGVNLNGGFKFCPWDGTPLGSSSQQPPKHAN